jgi:hypothetical protein
MKSHLLAILAVVLAPLSAFAQGTQVFHQNINGTTVTAFASDASGVTRSVEIFRNVANGVDSPQYTVLYQVGGCDGGYPITICDGQGGFGLVSGSAMSTGAQSAHLHLDTGAVSGFLNQSFHEVIDSTSGVPVITELDVAPSAGVVLDLTWRATNQFQSSSSGGSQETIFGTTLIVGGGTQSSTSADVQGTFGGVQLTGATGSIGSTHSSSVTVTKN